MRFASVCLVLLMAGSGLAGSAGHLCRMSGEVKRSCCCSDGDEGAAGPEKLTRGDPCCEAYRAAAAEIPAVTLEAAGSALEVPEPEQVGVVALSPPAARRQMAPPRARGPPVTKTPVFVWKSSYLI